MPFTTSFSVADAGVTVIIPVRNGAQWLRDALCAVLEELGTRRSEVIVIDDGSVDGSVAVAHAIGDPRVVVCAGEKRGAAAAINLGIRAARHEVIAQIDQDVIVRPGWLARLLTALSAPGVAAAQGCYVTDPAAPLVARVMSLDLEQRYARLRGDTDHVCTGNVVWRREAVDAVGGLDETLGYGYDNDLSYRLIDAGYQLTICAEATSFHRWRDGWRAYLTQQYGFGYGRLDLLARHRRRFHGDAVSPAGMMAHPIVMALALAAAALAGPAYLAGGAATVWLAIGAVLMAALGIERAIAGARAWRAHGDPAALLFPVFHLMRDVAWVTAIVVWSARAARRRPMMPGHSMVPRPPAPDAEGA
jgi:GT2 family glycosyltransferase